MSKSLRDLLEFEIKKTESEIAVCLENFYDKTGMIPEQVKFDKFNCVEQDMQGHKINKVHFFVNLNSHT